MDIAYIVSICDQGREEIDTVQHRKKIETDSGVRLRKGRTFFSLVCREGKASPFWIK